MRGFLAVAIAATLVAMACFDVVAQTRLITKPINSFTFAYATGPATNQSTVTVTAQDAQKNPIPYALFQFWVSLQPNGAPPGTVAAGCNTPLTIIGSTGNFITNLTTNAGIGVDQVLSVRAGAAGTAKIGICDSGKQLFYPVAESADGLVRVRGAAMAASNYALLFEGKAKDWMLAVITGKWRRA